MKKIFITFIFLLFGFIALSSCSFIGQTKIRDTKVYVEGNEIMADYFPYMSSGIKNITHSGVNFDFDAFDKFIYKQVKMSNKPYLYVVIRHADEDKYGNKTLGNKITIGKIDVKESKRYADFYHWSIKYGSYRMWSKDLHEYERREKLKHQPRQDFAPYISLDDDRYVPKSIR